MNKEITVKKLVLLMAFVSSHAFALSAVEVATKNEEARQIDTVEAKAKLTTGGPDKAERIKEFTWWRKLNTGKRFNTLTRFHFPPEVRGQGILFLEGENDESDIQMYLPSFKKVRRVESQQQSSSFMGSELSYTDIATPHVDDYNYKMVKDDEKCPGEPAQKCYVIEYSPKTDKVKDRTGNSRVVSWIRKDNFMGTKGEYYDLQNQLWKVTEASETKLVDTTKNKWMSLRIRVENQKNKRFTLLEFKDVKVNKPVGDSTFTVQNLSRD